MTTATKTNNVTTSNVAVLNPVITVGTSVGDLLKLDSDLVARVAMFDMEATAERLNEATWTPEQFDEAHADYMTVVQDALQDAEASRVANYQLTANTYGVEAIYSTLSSMVEHGSASESYQGRMNTALFNLTMEHATSDVDVSFNGFSMAADRILAEHGVVGKNGKQKIGEKGTTSYKLNATLRTALSRANTYCRKELILRGEGDTDLDIEGWKFETKDGVKSLALDSKEKTAEHALIEQIKLLVKDFSNVELFASIRAALDTAERGEQERAARVGNLKADINYTAELAGATWADVQEATKGAAPTVD